MSELTFRPIGNNPEADALSLHNLHSDSGVDHIIRNEFSQAVDFYSSKDLTEITNRIIDRYTGNNPHLVGDILEYNGDDVGMVYSGISDIEKPDNGLGVEYLCGANISTWVLEGFRGLGIGKLAIAHMTLRVVEKTCNPQDELWYEENIWTSIHGDNIASQKACEAAGFIRIYQEVDNPERFVYILQR